MRSLSTGRIRHWMLRNASGIEMPGTLRETIVVNDPGAIREAARLGLGVSLIALVDVLPELERGDLVRLLPDWYADAGTVSLYYASRTLVSAKTRVFVDFVVDAFKSQTFGSLAASGGQRHQRLRNIISEHRRPARCALPAYGTVVTIPPRQ